MQKVTRKATAQSKPTIRKTFFSLKVLVFALALLLIGTTLERPGTARGEDVAQNGNSAAQVSESAQNASLSFFARPEEDNTVSVTMVGDILLHGKVLENCRNDDGSYSFSSIFAGTKSVTGRADISLVNQEVIIGGTELGISGYPKFNAPYEIADALVEAGFNVICHATNHAVDKGKQGILNCLNCWSKNYPEISVIGLYGTCLCICIRIAVCRCNRRYRGRNGLCLRALYGTPRLSRSL